MAHHHELLRVAGVSAALVATDLYRFYHAGDDETLALRGVSLSVEDGELVAVVGPSGSGKSTLLACLAGLDEPDGGSVYVEDVRLSRRPEAERTKLRARRIGMLFQSANLIEHLNISANISLAQRVAGRVDHARRRELLDRLGIGSRATAYPSELSGGETARAGLAVALANDPAVVLADEPTGELDSASAERVAWLLREATQHGAAVVVVTHNPQVGALADRTLMLDDGRAVA
jgi:putative ABC transport system ATP-binding protein